MILPKFPLVPGRPDSVPVSVLGFGTSPLGHAYGVTGETLWHIQPVI